MQRISTTTKVVDKFGAGKHGFTNGNVVGGIPSTDLEDAWFDNVQEEIANVIEAAGVALNGAVKTQLLQSIQKVATGRLIGVQVLTASGTYTANAAATSIVVEGVGAGGGGGGCPATSASQQATGTGGLSGTYGRIRFTSGFTGGIAVTIPAGGTAGPAASGAGGNGGSGGSTVFGSLATFQGGQGGNGGTATASTSAAVGVVGDSNIPTFTGSGVLLEYQSGRSGPGLIVVGNATGQAWGGAGGDSRFGRGGAQVTTNPGSPGVGYGSGGGGCSQTVSNAGSGGGVGTQGRLVIWEYA